MKLLVEMAYRSDENSSMPKEEGGATLIRVLRPRGDGRGPLAQFLRDLKDYKWFNGHHVDLSDV
jgi:hypothetical protein